MITDIVIEDYQAVRKAQLRLGRLTVVTGPTGSGKSAVVRALGLAAFNARGTGYIRAGAKHCQVAVGCREEGWTVRVRRGGRGSDSYRIARPQPDPVPGEVPGHPVVQEFTKLAGAVPEQVTALLKLDEINFAGQFDRPFLLAEPGSQVARVLGALTNVTLVFDAAREANRRKLETARELKAREKTLEDLTAQALQFRTLKARREAAAAARDRLVKVQLAAGSMERLGALWSASRTAQGALRTAEGQLAVLAAPAAGQLDALQARYDRLRVLRSSHLEAGQAAATWGRQQTVLAAEEEKARQSLHDMLVAAGVCPTCGQPVEGK